MISPVVPTWHKAHWAVALGVGFVLTEGLLRKLLPAQYQLLILGFKFVYFPGLYLWLWLGMRNYGTPTVPLGLVLFMAYGTAMTLIGLLDWPTRSTVGLLVFWCAFPMAVLAAPLYADATNAHELFGALLPIVYFIGIVAVIQGQLSPDHWFNLGVDQRTWAITDRYQIRVSSTFQFTNILGSWCGLGVLIGFGHILTGERRRWLGGIGVALTLAAAYYSGSRTGLTGGLILTSICLPWVLVATASARAFALFAVLAGIPLMLLSLGDDAAGGGLEKVRGLRFDALGERLLSEYVGAGTFHRSLEESGFFGLGWGVPTEGVGVYVKKVLGVSEPVPFYAEGGPGHLASGVGVPGLLLFAFGVAQVLWRAAGDRGRLAPIGLGLGVWLVYANLPIHVFEISVVAIPFWLLLGLYWGNRIGERGAARLGSDRLCRTWGG